MSDLAETLRDEYRMRFEGSSAYRDRVWKILCRHYFGRRIPKEGRVLDLGAGWCEFINNIEAADKLAMDLNPDTASRLVEGARFLQQDCSEPWQVEAGSLDVVFTSNFLEHLPDKASVERTLGQAWRCLAPGGRVFCLGPNVKYLPGEYWDFWDHHVALTELSLSEVLALKGFEVETCIPRFLPYSMSTGRNPPLVFVRAYLMLPWAWRWFGKQFLVVARKGAAD